MIRCLDSPALITFSWRHSGERFWNSKKIFSELPKRRMGSPGLDSGEFEASKIVLDKLLGKYPSEVQGDIE